MQSLFLAALIQKQNVTIIEKCFQLDKIEKNLASVDEAIESDDFIKGFTKLDEILKKLIPILKIFE